MPRPIPEETRQAVLAAVKGGMTHAKAAKEYGVSPISVWRWVNNMTQEKPAEPKKFVVKPKTPTTDLLPGETIMLPPLLMPCAAAPAPATVVEEPKAPASGTSTPERQWKVGYYGPGPNYDKMTEWALRSLRAAATDDNLVWCLLQEQFQTGMGSFQVISPYHTDPAGKSYYSVLYQTKYRRITIHMGGSFTGSRYNFAWASVKFYEKVYHVSFARE